MQEIENLKALVRDAMQQCATADTACNQRKVLWWVWHPVHRWGKWGNIGTRATEKDGVTHLVLGRRCKRCGYSQTKTIPFGSKL